MMGALVFLDTNIFIYAAGKPHRYKNPCLHILKDIETQALRGVVNTEIFQELLYRYSYINLLEKGIQLCNDILKYPLIILSVTEADIRVAIEIVEQFKDPAVKPRDAIHAAVLKNNKIEQIISADRDFDVFDFLTRIDPQHYISKNK